jgi:ABC-type Na+ efflux pump permease subunit
VKGLVVVLVVLVVVALRLLARRRGQRRSSPLGALKGRLQAKRLLGDTGLVAGREIRERVRGRVFKVVTVILFAVVGAAVIIPTFHHGTTTHQRVGVVARSAALDAELQKLGTTVGLSVEVVHEPDLSAARDSLSAGRLDMVVNPPSSIVVENPISDTDTSATARYVRVVATALGAQQAFSNAGLTPTQAAAVARAKPLPVDSVQPG